MDLKWDNCWVLSTVALLVATMDMRMAVNLDKLKDLMKADSRADLKVISTEALLAMKMDKRCIALMGDY